MFNFANVLVFNPAGIGDSILATPVAAAIKQASPATCIKWVARPALRDLLLSVCPSIDDVVEFEDAGVRRKRLSLVEEQKPDLLVNLTGSPIFDTWTKVIGAFISASPRVPEVMPSASSHTDEHIVSRYLSISGQLDIPQLARPFPTIFPEAFKETMVAPLFGQLGLAFDEPIVGLVPGVGKGSPARSWYTDGWCYLVRSIKKNFGVPCLLVGGADDKELCHEIASEVHGEAIDLAGQLTLTETAALLKALAVVVGGDCGIIHMAVAAATPVIGLYGPTSSKQRGPYGHEELALDQHKRCNCDNPNYCHGASMSSGDCMHAIMLSEILEKLVLVLGPSSAPPGPVRESTNWFWAGKHGQASA